MGSGEARQPDRKPTGLAALAVVVIRLGAVWWSVFALTGGAYFAIFVFTSDSGVDDPAFERSYRLATFVQFAAQFILYGAGVLIAWFAAKPLARLLCHDIDSSLPTIHLDIRTAYAAGFVCVGTLLLVGKSALAIQALVVFIRERYAGSYVDVTNITGNYELVGSVVSAVVGVLLVVFARRWAELLADFHEPQLPTGNP